jgi:predicted Ser/Thr protein kinase
MTGRQPGNASDSGEPPDPSPPTSPPPAEAPTQAAPAGNQDEAPTLPPAPEAATLPPDGGAAEEWPATLTAAFGRYELRGRLGQGGMGTVYLAWDTQLERTVALKLPRFDTGVGAEGRARFLREARAAAGLSHPNLCPVYDVGVIDGKHYLTMAYVEGRPLSAVSRARALLPVAEVVALVRQLALALQEAHEHGVIHRDLKPANVMLNAKGQPVVMDFGLARRTFSKEEVRLTQSGLLVGTPAYMPPEQVNGDVGAMGPGCDVYSLGVILYELLTGRLPFDGPLGTLLAQIVLDPPPPPSRWRPDLDPAVERVCLRALAKQPADRFPSMRAFAEALDACLRGEPPSDATPPPAPTILAEVAPLAESPTATARPRRRSGWKVFFGCAALSVLTVVVACGGLAALFAWAFPRVQDLLKTEMARQQQWDEVRRFWRPPPADATPEQLFPTKVGEFTRVEQDAKAAVPELNFEAPGRRALYRSRRGDVELFAYRATKLEKEALFRRAHDKIAPKEEAFPGKPPDRPKGWHSVRGSPDAPWFGYSHGPPTQHGMLWWDKDWLFLARSRTIEDPGDFLKDYLASLGRGP